MSRRTLPDAQGLFVQPERADPRGLRAAGRPPGPNPKCGRAIPPEEVVPAHAASRETAGSRTRATVTGIDTPQAYRKPVLGGLIDEYAQAAGRG